MQKLTFSEAKRLQADVFATARAFDEALNAAQKAGLECSVHGADRRSAIGASMTSVRVDVRARLDEVSDD